MSELRWAPPRREDDEAWADLLAAIEAVDQRGETYELDDLDDEWASVWSHPETDAVAVWDGPELVAFGWDKTQVGRDVGHRISCWGGVRPSHRGRGIGRELLRRQLQRAAEIAATLDPALPADAFVEALDTQADLVRLARRLGLDERRRFLELARPASAVEPSPVPAGLHLRPWSEDVDEATRVAHAVAFAEHWGNEPRTVEEWRQWYTGHRSFRPDLSVVLVDGVGEVAAFVLAAAYPQDWHAVPRELWLTSVGTRRGWRGRGAATAALTAVLSAAAAAEDRFERVILGVDAQNGTGAVSLYRGLGFTDVRATTTFGRRLR